MISNKESGVAIWYILVGVALFAALSFSFVRSISQNQAGSNKEQAKVAANEIVRYAKSVEQAIQRLVLVNECSENDISLYSTKWSTPSSYDNPNTPSTGPDFTCHVYHPDGGGVEWKGAADLGYAPLFTSGCDVSGVGSTDADIVMIVRNVSQEICEQVNHLAGVDMATGDPDTQPYSCNYSSNTKGNFTKNGTLAGAARKPTACLMGSGSLQPAGQYYIYSTVLIR